MTRTSIVTCAAVAVVTGAAITGCDANEAPTTPEAPVTATVPGTGGDADHDDRDHDYDGGTDSATAPAAVAITISDFTFTPPTITVRPGAEVAVRNGAAVEHSVTADTAGMFDEDVAANSTETFDAPATPGTYTFHCTYHPEMRGTLVVE